MSKPSLRTVNAMWLGFTARVLPAAAAPKALVSGRDRLAIQLTL